MEVGAVKQAFNNEVILLKRPLNQARIQVIHKLTRKAKVLLASKAPENLKVKLKRKAEAAVNEVMIMKKIKPKDLAKFIVTHKDDINKHLNKPTVDLDKACARLLLHKSLQNKYKQMRLAYLNIPIDDLFMSRLERQKIKKEKKEMMNQKNNKNKTRTKKNSISSEGDWSIEDINDNVKSSRKTFGDDSKTADGDIEDDSKIADDSDDNSVSDNDKLDRLDNFEDSNSEDGEDLAEKESINQVHNDEINNKSSLTKKINKKGKDLKNSKEFNKKTSSETNLHIKPQLKEDKRTKLPKTNKNKNKKDSKAHTKKTTKEEDYIPLESNKVVDPFFKTVTGERYLSVAEPRAPDEFKEIHNQGNRQMRRAVMFGRAPQVKPRQNYRQDNNYKRFNKNNADDNYKFNKNYNGSNDTFKNSVEFSKDPPKEVKPEKLHPSWEAKKKISNILPFKGKKITFNED